MSKIAAPLTSILKTTRSSKKLALKAFKVSNNKVVEDGGRADKTVVDSSKLKNQKSRNLIRIPHIRVIREPNFLTPNAKKTFNHLQLAFIKVLILQYFDLESYIQIETNA